MWLNYSKEAIDSEFDLFEIINECDWFLPVCKYILYVQQIANVCVCVCVSTRVCIWECVHRIRSVYASVHACVGVRACVCVKRKVCTCFGVHIV